MLFTIPPPLNISYIFIYTLEKFLSLSALIALLMQNSEVKKHTIIDYRQPKL